jgi:hypothetical protein
MYTQLTQVKLLTIASNMLYSLVHYSEVFFLDFTKNACIYVDAF